MLGMFWSPWAKEHWYGHPYHGRWLHLGRGGASSPTAATRSVPLV